MDEKKIRRKCYHNIFTINFNIGEKKNNFNSMFKLKSVSIFITNVFAILSQLILSGRLLLVIFVRKK